MLVKPYLDFQIKNIKILRSSMMKFCSLINSTIFIQRLRIILLSSRRSLGLKLQKNFKKCLIRWKSSIEIAVNSLVNLSPGMPIRSWNKKLKIWLKSFLWSRLLQKTQLDQDIGRLLLSYVNKIYHSKMKPSLCHNCSRPLSSNSRKKLKKLLTLLINN